MEGISGIRVHELIVEAIRGGNSYCDLNASEIRDALSECNEIKTVLDSRSAVSEKVEQVSSLLSIAFPPLKDCI